MALLQISSTPISLRLPSPVMILFNRLTGDILPKFNRQLVLCDNNESNFIVLLERQVQAIQDIDTHKKKSASN